MLCRFVIHIQRRPYVLDLLKTLRELLLKTYIWQDNQNIYGKISFNLSVVEISMNLAGMIRLYLIVNVYKN